MSRSERDDRDSSAIATKAELLQRLRDRHKPQAHSQLTPSGPDVQQSYKTLLAENERRIASLRASLHNAHDVLEVQHSFTRLDGFAVARFSKER